jgi:hypothetical protein
MQTEDSVVRADGVASARAGSIAGDSSSVALSAWTNLDLKHIGKQQANGAKNKSNSPAHEPISKCTDAYMPCVCMHIHSQLASYLRRLKWLQDHLQNRIIKREFANFFEVSRVRACDLMTAFAFG